EKRRVVSAPVEFLQRLRPEGPWLLIAIEPDGPATGKTCRSAAEVDQFVEMNDGQRNLYYAVNPTRAAMSKKAAKTDVTAVQYAWADLDPADDETPEQAKARYLEQLNGAFAPQPTAVVDSGNGIQCLWRLEEPIALGEPVTIVDSDGKCRLELNAADK